MSESAVLTVPAVAEQLGVSRWTIYERIRRHEIPVVHVGRAVRVPRIWLDSLLADAMSDRAGSSVSPTPEDPAEAVAS